MTMVWDETPAATVTLRHYTQSRVETRDKRGLCTSTAPPVSTEAEEGGGGREPAPGDSIPEEALIMTLTELQQKTLSIIPHITGTMSLLGATSIIYDILSDLKEKLNSPYYRILLAMGCVDLSSSFWLGLSTWPVPRGTANVYGAVGTTASCSAQGFFSQLNLLGPLYNLNLALYYLLLGKYHLTDEEIAERYERYMHPISLTIAIVFSIAGLPLTLYNNANLWCWIAPYPANCEDNNGQHGDVPCERGNDAWLYRWLFFYCPLWIIIVTVTVILIMLIRSAVSDERRFIALQKETRSKRPSTRLIETASSTDDHPVPPASIDINETHRYERSRQTFRQAMFYLGVFYLTWVFQTVNRLYQLITGDNVFILLVLHTIFGPLHGFFNFIVYRHGQITV